MIRGHAVIFKMRTIESHHELSPVTPEVCTSTSVSLDSAPYSLLNCEVVAGPSLLFLSLYVGGAEAVMGAVTLKRPYDDYLGLRTPGFLLDRWSFARVQ